MSLLSEYFKVECIYNGFINNIEDIVKWLLKEKNDIIVIYFNNWFWFSDDSNICCNIVLKFKRLGIIR